MESQVKAGMIGPVAIKKDIKVQLQANLRRDNLMTLQGKQP